MAEKDEDRLKARKPTEAEIDAHKAAGHAVYRLCEQDDHAERSVIVKDANRQLMAWYYWRELEGEGEMI